MQEEEKTEVQYVEQRATNETHLTPFVSVHQLPSVRLSLIYYNLNNDRQPHRERSVGAKRMTPRFRATPTDAQETEPCFSVLYPNYAVTKAAAWFKGSKLG